jgi:hypothetical protein
MELTETALMVGGEIMPVRAFRVSAYSWQALPSDAGRISLVYQRSKPSAKTVLRRTKAVPKSWNRGAPARASRTIRSAYQSPVMSRTSGNRALVLTRTLAHHPIISIPASAAIEPVCLPRASVQSRYQRIDRDSDETVALQRLRDVSRHLTHLVVF